MLLLIFAERVSDIVHSEARVIRIVAGLQPKLLSESCTIGEALYAKRKGANLTIGSYNGLPPPFHKERERGWIVNIIGGIKPTLQAENLGSAKLRSQHLLTPIICSTLLSHSNKKKPNPKDSA